MRSFNLTRSLCQSLLPCLARFEAEAHIAAETSLMPRVVDGLPFDNSLWRALIGEVLLYAAIETPEIPDAAATLTCLLAPETLRQNQRDRQPAPPIVQIHRGTRDLLFGMWPYRPEWCGWNDGEDVRRLAIYLTSLEPNGWQADQLANLPGLTEEEREEELQTAGEWLVPLREMYERAASKKQAIVCEIL